MWTEATRSRMARIEKQTKRYSTDLTDEEWSLIEPLMPQKAPTGRPRGSVSVRASLIIAAVLP